MHARVARHRHLGRPGRRARRDQRHQARTAPQRVGVRRWATRRSPASTRATRPRRTSTTSTTWCCAPSARCAPTRRSGRAGRRGSSTCSWTSTRTSSPRRSCSIRILAAPQDALLAVGDDDQTLYGFRRASVRRMLELDLAYPGLERVALAHNYRCPPAVVEASRALIDHNAVRFPKRIEPAPGRTGAPDRAARAGDRRRRAPRGSRARSRTRGAARWSCSPARPTSCAPSRSRARTRRSRSAPRRACSSRAARAMALEAHLRLCGEPRHARPEDVAPSSAPRTAASRTRRRRRPPNCSPRDCTFTRALAALRADDRRRGKLDEAGRTLDALARDHRRAPLHPLPAAPRRPRRALRGARGGVRRHRADRARGARPGRGRSRGPDGRRATCDAARTPHRRAAARSATTSTGSS